MDNSGEMPRYRCHKEVHALKILRVELDNDAEEAVFGRGIIFPEDEKYSAFKVSRDYMRKHEPRAGGYYIIYKDGYESFSPARSFEDGYNLVTEEEEAN